MGLTVVEFGDQLLRTRDLDPVYVAVAASNLDTATLHRLCLAYWCFYSLGTAAHLAEIKQPKRYWDAMEEAAANVGEREDGSKPWPRGAERRHFRGEQATRPMAELRAKYKTATDAVVGMTGIDGGSGDFKYVSQTVQEHRGFGPWIAFKIADMAERVLRIPVDFENCELGIYKDPRQGAAIAYLALQDPEDAEQMTPDGKPWNYPITDSELKATVDHYVALWRKKRAKAPPHNDRLVNVQEVETIFCKYKSHLKGHYPIGKDCREVFHGLHGWGDLADQLARELPLAPKEAP